MYLDKLESGLLLFETPEGLIALELSFWQRVYLLWTFRNFRRLSIRLLNARQAATVQAAAQRNAKPMWRSYDPSFVVGIIEDFRLPIVPTDAAIEAKRNLSPAIEPAATNKTIDRKWSGEQPALARNKEIFPEQQSDIEVGPKIDWHRIDWHRIAGPKIEWVRLAWSRLASSMLTWSKPTWLRPTSPNREAFRHQWIRFERFGTMWMKQSTPRLATAAGVLFLCVGSIVAWHRMGAVAGSEAHSRPIETGPTAAIESTPLSTSALRKTSVVENSSAIGAARSKAAGNQESALTAPILPRGPAVDVIKPTAEVASIASVPERQPHIQNVSPTATVTMAESEIQATRPPLHSVYPDFSGVEARGVVALTAEVDSDGVVRSVRVVRGNRALAAASVRAVRQWRYAPHFEDGKPVATETNIVISAFSDDAISMSFPPSISVSP